MGIAVRSTWAVDDRSLKLQCSCPLAPRVIGHCTLQRAGRGVGGGRRARGWPRGQRPGLGHLGRRSRSMQWPISISGAIARLTGWGLLNQKRAVSIQENCAASRLGDCVARGWAYGKRSARRVRHLAGPGLVPARPREATVGEVLDDERGLRGTATSDWSMTNYEFGAFLGCSCDKHEWLAVANKLAVYVRWCCVLVAGWPRGSSRRVRKQQWCGFLARTCAVGQVPNTDLNWSGLPSF